MTTQPSCYGKSWDPNHVECKGGLDPAYENPTDQSHRRDRCTWFGPCSQQMRTPNPPLIPTRSLLPSRPAMEPPPRPLAPTPSYQPQTYSPPRPLPLIPQPPMQTVYPPALPPAQPQYQQPQAQAHYAQMVPPNVAQYGPQFVPAPYQLPGSQMPQFLSVLEPADDGSSWIGRLGRESARGLIKGLAHSVAAFFDSNPFRKHKS